MIRGSRRIHACLLIAVLVCGVRAAAAPADPLADLDAPDYAVRLAATESLLTDSTLTLDRVRQWLGGDLSLEQRHRLLGVARHLIYRRVAQQADADAEPDPDKPAIALGIDFLPRQISALTPDEPQGAIVVRTLPGLPAHGRLRPDDRIVALNGKRLDEQPDEMTLPKLLAELPVDQPVRLGVLRAGEPMTVSFSPARHAQLMALYDSRSGLRPQARAAWERFLASIDSHPAGEPEAQALISP